MRGMQSAPYRRNPGGGLRWSGFESQQCASLYRISSWSRAHLIFTGRYDGAWGDDPRILRARRAVEGVREQGKIDEIRIIRHGTPIPVPQTRSSRQLLCLPGSARTPGDILSTITMLLISFLNTSFCFDWVLSFFLAFCYFSLDFRLLTLPPLWLPTTIHRLLVSAGKTGSWIWFKLLERARQYSAGGGGTFSLAMDVSAVGF